MNRTSGRKRDGSQDSPGSQIRAPHRRVNDVTVDDHYPLSVLKVLLMSLGRGNKIFSFDLISGYWEVPIAPASRKVTSFSTPRGHYEWLKMPTGLKGTSLTLQRLFNDVFASILGKHVFAYLDDIIVTGKNPETHLGNLELVFQRLQTAGLKVKLLKCELLRSKINFLGHTVDGHGIHTDDSKVLAVKQFPQPKTVENVRSYLGLAGYYRSFIKGFATIASLLTRL